MAAEREYGSFKFSNNFEVQIAAPLDARTIAKKYWYIKDSDFWKYTDGKYYLYKGIVVSVYEDGIGETDTSGKSDPTIDENGMYMFIGDPYETDPNSPKHFSKDHSWLKINDASDTKAVVFDFSDKDIVNGEYLLTFTAPYNFPINSFEENGNRDNVTYSLDDVTYYGISDPGHELDAQSLNKWDKIYIKVLNPVNYILKLNVYPL